MTDDASDIPGRHLFNQIGCQPNFEVTDGWPSQLDRLLLSVAHASHLRHTENIPILMSAFEFVRLRVEISRPRVGVVRPSVGTVPDKN